MFCVFGKSRHLAKRRVMKQAEKYDSKISIELRKSESLSLEEKQLILNDFFESEFLKMKEKKCTQDFSAPGFARDALNLMKKNADDYRNLKIKKKKLKGMNKKTGRKIFEWVDL